MKPGAKFIFMSSGASILDRIPDKTDVCYGITKASKIPSIKIILRAH